jgi:hypothetical protein
MATVTGVSGPAAAASWRPVLTGDDAVAAAERAALGTSARVVIGLADPTVGGTLIGLEVDGPPDRYVTGLVRDRDGARVGVAEREPEQRRRVLAGYPRRSAVRRRGSAGALRRRLPAASTAA